MVIVMVIVIDNEKVSEKKLAWIEEDHPQERGITALTTSKSLQNEWSFLQRVNYALCMYSRRQPSNNIIVMLIVLIVMHTQDMYTHTLHE